MDNYAANDQFLSLHLLFAWLIEVVNVISQIHNGLFYSKGSIDLGNDWLYCVYYGPTYHYSSG
jgi:hypothetical protein